MASISKTRIENDIAPFLLTKLQKSVVDLLVNEDFLNLMNGVANDLNEAAELNVERYYKKTGTDNAEDDEATNYLTQGVILKIYEFIYNGSDYQTQAYCFANDRFFLKTEPSDDIQLDVSYLRQCEDMSADSDTIDLPDQVHFDYLELLKVKILADYGDLTPMDYQAAVQFYGQKARQRCQNRYLASQGVRRQWMGQSGDDRVYDITGQWIGLDNFATDVNSDYYYTGG